MDATITLPEGGVLELREDGRWVSNDAPGLAEALNTAPPALPLGYWPEPVVVLARVVAELVGGEVVQAVRSPKPPEGAIQ